MNRLRGYVELLRLHNVFLTFLAVAIGVLSALHFLGSAGINSREVMPTFVLAALTASLVAAGGYVINDYFDRDIDAVNKPWRPIPAGVVKPHEAVTLATILFLLGSSIPIAIGPLSSSIAALVSLLMILYSMSLKRRGVVGNIVVALSGALSIFYGTVAVIDSSQSYVGIALPQLILSALPTIHAFLLILLREFVKGIEDIRGDSARGVQTLIVVLGPRKTYKVMLLVASTLIGISIVPFLTGLGLIYLVLALVVDALVVYTMYLLRPSNLILGIDAMEGLGARGRRLLKYAFGIGIAAFLLGLLSAHLNVLI